MARTSPIILRSGYIFNNWKSHWFSDNNYTCLLTEDLKIRYYMNNVHYYLKLPSSELSVRRPQNQINIMHNSIYIPEYTRVEKVAPFKFNFFRFKVNKLNMNITSLIVNKLATVNKSFVTLLAAFYTNIYNSCNNNSKLMVLLLKFFCCGYIQRSLLTSSALSEFLYYSSFSSTIKCLLSFKLLANLLHGTSLSLDKFTFERSINDKLFNKNHNLFSLFELISGEDILLKDIRGNSKGSHIINSFKKKTYTTNSIMLLDSFGKQYRYNPQKKNKQFPYYDFMNFYKLNLLKVLKVYTHYSFYNKKKRRKKFTSKRLKRRYYARYVLNVISKINSFKYVLGYLISLNNKLVLLSKLNSFKVYTNLNAYIYKTKGLQSSNHLAINLLYNKFNNLLSNTRNKKNKKFTKRHIVRGLNRVLNSQIFNAKNISLDSHTIALKKKLFNFIKYTYNQNILSKFSKYVNRKNKAMNKYSFFKKALQSISFYKRNIFEYLNSTWKELSINCKLINSRFRRLKVRKLTYYKRYIPKNYTSDFFNNKWSLNQIDANINIPFVNNAYSSIYISSFHPILNWIKQLSNINNAYKNKLTNLNRYLNNKRPSLTKLGKAAYYFIKLRKRKRRVIDKFDIRYIPRGWHNKSKMHHNNSYANLKLNKKRYKAYLKQIRQKYSKRISYNILKNRLKGLQFNIKTVRFQNMLDSRFLNKKKTKLLRNKVRVSVLMKYFQKLVKIKKKLNNKLKYILTQIKIQKRRGFRTRLYKLKHLNYIRLFAQTLKYKYPIYFKTIYNITKPYIDKRIRKMVRNPEGFYSFKKRKLPLFMNLKTFKQILQEKKNNFIRRKYNKGRNNWSWNKNYKHSYKKKYYSKHKLKVYNKFLQALRSHFQNKFKIKKNRRKYNTSYNYNSKYNHSKYNARTKNRHRKKGRNKGHFSPINKNRRIGYINLNINRHRFLKNVTSTILKRNYKFQNKLLNLLIFNYKSRFLLLQHDIETFQAFKSAIRGLYHKQFKANLIHLRRSRYRIKYKFYNKYDYKATDLNKLKRKRKDKNIGPIQGNLNTLQVNVSILRSKIKPLQKKINILRNHIRTLKFKIRADKSRFKRLQHPLKKTQNRLKTYRNQLQAYKRELSKLTLQRQVNKTNTIHVNHLISYIYPHLKPLSKSNILKGFVNNLKRDHKFHSFNQKFKKKGVSVYVMLCIFRFMLFNYKYINSYSNLYKISNMQHNTTLKSKGIINFSSFYEEPRHKIHRSYHNYKVRINSKLMRARYHYKHLYHFLAQKNNKLMHHYSYLKLLLSKISAHVTKIFKDLHNFLPFAVTSSYDLNKGSNVHITRSFRLDKTNRYRTKFLYKNASILNSVFRELRGLLFQNGGVKLNALKRTIKSYIANKFSLHQFITYKKYSNYRPKLLQNTKGSLNALLFSFIKTNLGSNYPLDLMEKLMSDRFKNNTNPYKYHDLLDKQKYPITKRTSMYKYNYTSDLKILSSDDKIGKHMASNSFIFANDQVVHYTNLLITPLRYLSRIKSLYSKLMLNLVSKYNDFVEVCDLKSLNGYNLYQHVYQYMFQNHFFVVKVLRSLIQSLDTFIYSNLFKNLVRYIKIKLLDQSINFKNSMVNSITYDWKRYSYLNMASLTLISTTKKSYFNNYNLVPLSTESTYSNSDLSISSKIDNSHRSLESKGDSIESLYNIGSFMDEDVMKYLQLNYVMEYDANKLSKSKENFLYFYNLYTYNYDYNCMFILNPRLLCDYFVFAIKNKVQYYEIYGDIKEAFSDLRRLQRHLKRIYDRILYRFLHRYIDTMTDWYFFKLRKDFSFSSDDVESVLFFKKLKRLTSFFSYLVYLIEVRNHLNICGLHIKTGGRRSRKLRTHTRLYQRGKMSLNTFSDNIDYYFKPVLSRFGTLGLKIFIYRESCYRIPLLQIMYETLFLRFRLLRSLLAEKYTPYAKR